MINIIAVDSIRTLSFSSVYGFSLVFFYLLVSLSFFIPTALVAAELGTGWPNRGGIYIWVREAFGKKWSLATIWLNWIYNIIWYPTIMALIAGTLTYLFDPELSQNKFYMCLSVLILFWGATLIHCFGMRASSLFSTIGAIFGTLLPMIFIAVLGLIWIFQNKTSQIVIDWEHFFPTSKQTDNLAFLTNVLFGLLGIEMAATHAADMRNPAKDYPRSIFLAAIAILSTIILGSLAIAVVVPNKELSLATGVMQAFQIFLSSYELSWLLPVIAICIALGGLSGAGAWIISPTKGLLAASEDGSLPAFFSKTNRQGVPVRILLVQAILVSLLSLVFILLPTVNSTYWILSVITGQLALFVYIALFAAALKLHSRYPHVQRSFRVPGGKWGMKVVCLIGTAASASVILFGFIPPAQVPFGSVFFYEFALIAGIALCIAPPFFLK